MSSLPSVEVDNLLGELFKLGEDIRWKARFIDQFRDRSFSNPELESTSAQALYEFNERLSRILAAYVVNTGSKYPERLRKCVRHEIERRRCRMLFTSS